MQSADFTKLLNSGECDDFLDLIPSIVKFRQHAVMKQKAYQAADNVNIGTKIRITRMRPMCFENYTGTVSGIVSGDRFEVDMDIPSYMISQQMRRYLRNGTRKTLSIPRGTFELWGS